MATDLERMVIVLEANVTKLDNAMKRAAGQFDRNVGRMEKRVSDFQKSLDRVNADKLNSVFQLAGLTATGAGLIELANNWQQFQNRLKASEPTLANAEGRLIQLNEIANRSRSSLGGVVDLYSRLTIATSKLGVSQQDVAKATETVTKALALSGASVKEQESVITQLGQGLSSGILQGDELRALREASPKIAQAIADEFSTTIGGLKKLGAEGALTADRVFKAILKSNQAIEESFNKTNPTIKQAGTVLVNAFTEFIGTSGTSVAAANLLSETFLFLSKNIDVAANALLLLATAFAALKVEAFLTSVQGGAGALGAFVKVMRMSTIQLEAQAAAMGVTAAASGRWGLALRAAGAALGPVGIAIAAATAGLVVLELVMGRQESPTKRFTNSLDLLNSTIKQSEKTANDYAKGGLKGIVSETEKFTEAEEKAYQAAMKLNDVLKQRGLSAALSDLLGTDEAAKELQFLGQELKRLTEVDPSRDPSLAAINQYSKRLAEGQLKDVKIKIGADGSAALAEIDKIQKKLEAGLITPEKAGRALKDLIDQSKFKQFSDEFQQGINEIVKSLLGAREAIEETFKTNEATVFNKVLSQTKSTAADLVYVLDNAQEFSFGDIGADVFNEANTFLKAAKDNALQLKNNLRVALDTDQLAQYSQLGEAQKARVVEAQNLAKAFNEGSISFEQLALGIRKIGAQDTFITPLINDANIVIQRYGELENKVKQVQRNVLSKVPTAGPTRANTERRLDLSPFEKEAMAVKASTEEINGKNAALRRLFDSQKAFNSALEAELIYLDAKRKIEQGRDKVVSGSQQDIQLRALATEKALANQKAFTLNIENQYARSATNTTKELLLQANAVANLNGASGNYIVNKEIEIEYARQMADMYARLGEEAEKYASKIRGDVTAQVLSRQATETNKAVKDLTNSMLLEIDAIIAQSQALAMLNPAQANYMVQLQAMQIAQAKVNEFKQRGLTLTQEEINNIRALADEQARVNAAQQVSLNTNASVDANNAQVRINQMMIEGMRELNPLSRDYAIELQVLTEVVRKKNEMMAAGIDITSAAAQAELDSIAQTTRARELSQRSLDSLKATIEAIRSTSENAMKGLVQDLIAGKSAGEAFAAVLNKIADKLLDLVISDIFSGTNSSSIIGDLFGGIFGRAVGGTVSAGRPYMVGESGRELFVPNQKGTIIPLDKLGAGGGGGGSTVVNVNNYSGQPVTQTSRMQGNTEMIEIVVGEVQKRMTRGGFDKQMADRYKVNPATIGR